MTTQILRNAEGLFLSNEKGVFRIPEQHGLNIKAAAENAQRHIDAITAGYRRLGENDETSHYEHMRAAIGRSRDVRYTHPFIIAGSKALLRWAFSQSPTWTGDDSLLDVVELITGNAISDAWDFIDNAECELQDGTIIVSLVANSDNSNVAASKMDALEFHVENNVKSPFSAKRTWLHYRTHKGDNKDIVTFHPDVAFYPDNQLMIAMESRVEKKYPDASIDWSKRIARHDFNGGYPLIAAAIDYALCLNSIIELQSAVLTAIAGAATNFVTDDVDEIMQAQAGFEQIREDNEDGQFTSHTVIGSGRLQAVNLNVAMLSFDSALVTILYHMVYNAFADLRPQDFAESEVGGLNGGNNRNQSQIVGAQMRQQEWTSWYVGLMHGIFAVLRTQGTNTSGVEISEQQYILDETDVITVYGVKSDLSLEWPEIDSTDATELVGAMVDAWKLGSEIGAGTAEEFATGITSKLGVTMTASDTVSATENLDKLIELGDDVSTLVAEFDAIYGDGDYE